MAGRIVIEYTHKGYSEPDWLQAPLVDCKVTFTQDAPHLAGSLGDVRLELEDRGFTMHGVCQISQRSGGRFYDPTWREVWTG